MLTVVGIKTLNPLCQLSLAIPLWVWAIRNGGDALRLGSKGNYGWWQVKQCDSLQIMCHI